MIYIVLAISMIVIVYHFSVSDSIGYNDGYNNSRHDKDSSLYDMHKSGIILDVMVIIALLIFHFQYKKIPLILLIILTVFYFFSLVNSIGYKRGYKKGFSNFTDEHLSKEEEV